MKRLLLIDDMQGIRDALEVILASSYQLDIAADGQEGIAKLADGHYDLIITDILMPKMDGNELILQAKKKTNIPILAISAGGNGVSPDQALTMANQLADDVLKKPFSKAELLEKIEQMLG